MSGVDPAPRVDHVPPLAQLPRIREILNDVCSVLEQALAPMQRFRMGTGDEYCLRLAVGFHALNGLDAARAVYTLSGTKDHAGTSTLFFRVAYEAFVKIRWMRLDPKRARTYIESEPFERYALATDRVRNSKHWPEILKDCADTIVANPDLMKLKKASTGKNNPPNYDAIARGMRMPSLSVMATELGMDDEDLLIGHDGPSLLPHTSIMHARDFCQSINADGTVNLKTTIDPHVLVTNVARTAGRTGEILQQILELCPNSAIQFDGKQISRRLQDVVFILGGLVRLENE